MVRKIGKPIEIRILPEGITVANGPGLPRTINLARLQFVRGCQRGQTLMQLQHKCLQGPA